MQIDQHDVEAVIDIAHQAGDLVRQMQDAGLRNVRSKTSAGDLVTEADVASERLIRNALAQLYPSVALWGEESNEPPQTEYYWLVDPIDGTTNYAFGLDYNAVNIALQRNDATLLGVTCQIHTGRIYYARAGAGAIRREANGAEAPLHVNAIDELGHALVATGFPYHTGATPDNNTAEFAQVTQRAAGVRCLGAAALDLAHVASGALSAFWEGWLHPWDAAAGVLFVREAGGRVTTYTGDEWTVRTRAGLVASNGRLGVHDALLETIQQARLALAESWLDRP